MKHLNTPSHQPDILVPEPSEAEDEARAFRSLHASQTRWAQEHDAAVVVYQSPDHRTLFQRLAGWWSLRGHAVQATSKERTAPVRLKR